MHDFLTNVDIRLRFSSSFDPKETGDEMKTCVAKVIFCDNIMIILRGGSISIKVWNILGSIFGMA